MQKNIFSQVCSPNCPCTYSRLHNCSDIMCCSPAPSFHLCHRPGNLYFHVLCAGDWDMEIHFLILSLNKKYAVFFLLPQRFPNALKTSAHGIKLNLLLVVNKGKTHHIWSQPHPAETASLLHALDANLTVSSTYVTSSWLPTLAHTVPFASTF